MLKNLRKIKDRKQKETIIEVLTELLLFLSGIMGDHPLEGTQNKLRSVPNKRHKVRFVYFPKNSCRLLLFFDNNHKTYDRYKIHKILMEEVIYN